MGSELRDSVGALVFVFAKMVGLCVEDSRWHDCVPEGVLWDFESVRVEGR